MAPNMVWIGVLVLLLLLSLKVYEEFVRWVEYLDWPSQNQTSEFWIQWCQCLFGAASAVGQLQFEVVQARLENEYGVESIMEPLSYSLARWADGGWDAVDKADADGKLFGIMIVQDRWKRPVLLFRNDWKAASLAEEEKELILKPWSQPPDFEG